MLAIRGAFSRFFAESGFFLAAGLAFFFLICCIPMTLLGVSTLGFVLSTERAADEVVGQLARNFPVYRREIAMVLLRIIETRALSGIAGTLVLVFFSTPLFGASRLVMHRMLGVQASGGFVRNLLLDAVLVLLLTLLLFLASVVTAIFQWFQEYFLEAIGVPWTWLYWIAVAFSLSLSTGMFYFGYRYVPRRRPRASAAVMGAILTAMLWEIAKQLFRLYIRRVGVYDQIYGPLGVLIAFVMFVYYTCIVFVFGAASVASLDAYGRVDVVVNNAGILRDRMIFNMSEEEWDAVINTHLKGTFAVTRAAAPLMREQKWGRFINMTSTSGLIGNVGQANYAAAKLGIFGLTKVTALDMARYNVTANCISPFAWTRMIGTIPTETEAQKARVEKIKKLSPAHIAPVAAFLATDQAKDITGQIFGVRGKEIMLFGHPRPIMRVHDAEGWTVEKLIDIFPGTLQHHLVPNVTSGQYFNYDPLV